MNKSKFEVQQISTEKISSDCFFLMPEFIEYQKKAQGKSSVSFALISQDGHKMAASFTLAGSGSEWTSPITGAFGGITLYQNLPIFYIENLISESVSWIKREGLAKKCRVRLAPASFDPTSNAMVSNLLFRLGWSLESIDLNFHFDAVPKEKFFSSLGETKQKEIRRLKRSNATAKELPFEHAKFVYDVIARNRQSCGFPMTMSWPALSDLASAFMDRVKFFGVLREGEYLAGAICLIIRPDYLYVFYWGDNPDFRKESPVMLLAEEIADYAYRNEMRVVDIGTSTELSVPNEGLVAFKLAIGSIVTQKMTFSLEI